MMPSYRYMDSNPNQQDQLPWMKYHYPTFGPNFPKMDASGPPFMYDSWPYENYPNSVPSHVCCNHNGPHFPGFYAARPPCSHIQPGPPCQWYGNYPPYHERVYMPPPPHYSVELPSYEHDKDGDTYHHCCGWPNHPHDHRKASCVKIEEHEPGIEKMCNSSVPGQMKNYPYPVVWMPPENGKMKEQLADQSSVPRDVGIPQYMKMAEQGQPWNGWFPIDANSRQSLMQGNNRKRTQSREIGDQSARVPGEESKVLNRRYPFPFNLIDRKMQKEDGKMKEDQQAVENSNQFPYPIIWMPSSNKQEEVGNDSSKTAGETPYFKFIPVNSPVNDDTMNKLKADEEKNNGHAGGKTLEAHSNKETGHMDTPRRKDQFEDGESRDEQSKNNEADKHSKTAAKRDLTSSPKASKLRPICLRVDPMPRKNNGNGSSRSPSPPERAENRVKGVNSSEMKEENKKCDTTNQIKSAKLKKSAIESSEAAGLAKVTVGEETIKPYKSIDLQASADRVHKPERKLSDVEAAVLIQSAFRGFEVRRWEPLKKLKQLAKVREQMTEVKTRVQALESSVDLMKDDKQRLIIGEMIMNLLLKLDAIQGLHPNFRDIRKTLVKELVSLQKRLDALMTNTRGQSTAEVFTYTPTSNSSVDTMVQNEEESGVCGNHCKNPTDISEIVKEKEQDQTQLPNIADASDSRDKEVPIVESFKEEEQGMSENEQSPPQALVREGSSVLESVNNEGVGQPNSLETPMLNEDAKPNLLAELPADLIEEGVNFSATENLELQRDEAQPNAKEALFISQSEDSVKVEYHVDDQRVTKEVNNDQVLTEVTADTFLSLTMPLDNDERKDEVNLLSVPDFGADANKDSGMSIDEHEWENNVPVILTEDKSDSYHASNEQITIDQEQEISPQLASASQVYKKLIEENEKLREMMEKLILAGSEQLDAISKLSGRVKDLEKKLSKKKKLKMRHHQHKQSH